MTQRDRALNALPSDESEVDRRYTTILRSLQALLPGHGALLDELDASVSEILAEADDRARRRARPSCEYRPPGREPGRDGDQRPPRRPCLAGPESQPTVAGWRGGDTARRFAHSPSAGSADASSRHSASGASAPADSTCRQTWSAPASRWARTRSTIV